MRGILEMNINGFKQFTEDNPNWQEDLNVKSREGDPDNYKRIDIEQVFFLEQNLLHQ